MTDDSVPTGGTASERLSRSRAQLAELFDPHSEPQGLSDDGVSKPKSGFPRSVIMKALTRNGGTAGLALLAVAVFAARPRLAARLLRYLPVSAITRVVVARFIDAQGAKK